MRGLLWGSTAKTNEEYKKVVKRRIKLMTALVIVGIITALFGLLAEFNFDLPINDQMLGVYTGVGTDLSLVGALLLFKNRILLNNDTKLKESRLNNTDERILEIGNKALRTATFVMIGTSYVGALIGGLFYPMLVKVLLFVVCIFVLTYAIAFKYYNNRM
jgi:uncharacterized membrane protein